MWGIRFNKLNPFSGLRVRDLVVVSFTENELKIASLQVSSYKRDFPGVVVKQISGLPDNEVTKILKSTVASFNLKKPLIVDCLPAHQVITKNIEIPSTNPIEIREIINLQAGRHTPYSREEILSDYLDIGTYKHSYTKILLVIVTRPLIKRHADIIERAGLKLEKVVLISEALCWFLPRLVRAETEAAPVALLHIDDEFTDFIISFKGKLLFARAISLGAQLLASERQKYELKFVDEVKRSLEAYQSENIEKNPATFVVTGALQELGFLETALKQGVSGAVKMLPFVKAASLSDSIIQRLNAAPRISYLNVIACGYAWEELKVDLIPEEIKFKRALEARGKDLIRTAVLFLVVFFLIFLTFSSKIYFKNLYLSKVDAKLKELTEDVADLEKDSARIALIRNYLVKRGYSLDSLNEIYTVLPDGMLLSEARFEEQQGRGVFRGMAESMSKVFSFIEGLEKSAFFKDVKTKYTTKRKIGSAEVTDFELNCDLER
ncbi:MAG: pilus assembly protein PilM [Candidatus Omnitrophica bacterium]|nr:pilus assembly protein PilM [Candidatus Omnitrophota bacterium]